MPGGFLFSRGYRTTLQLGRGCCVQQVLGTSVNNVFDRVFSFSGDYKQVEHKPQFQAGSVPAASDGWLLSGCTVRLCLILKTESHGEHSLKLLDGRGAKSVLKKNHSFKLLGFRS